MIQCVIFSVIGYDLAQIEKRLASIKVGRIAPHEERPSL
jgi:hypothetical protein